MKYILKKAVRGVIPDEIIDRKKQGFGVPVYEWFFGALGERTRRELDEFCGETDFIDRKAVTALIEQHQGPQLWYLLNLALWWKHFIAERRMTSSVPFTDMPPHQGSPELARGNRIPAPSTPQLSSRGS